MVSIGKTNDALSDGQSFFIRVYDAVKKIPKGKVATYGQIALLSGSPRAARIVGWALHNNPEPGVIPCHRVVNRRGRLAPTFAFGGAEIQQKMLEAEGVFLNSDGFVDLAAYLWTPKDFAPAE
jgi:methylated-DNA-protein-cysteine methyltransferase-like protein